MLLRRATPLAFAIAAIACEPSVPFDPAAHNPSKVDYAGFDPTGSPPSIPLPNDLALLPQAIATQPPAQRALLTLFAQDTCVGGLQGCFPNDQEVPITIDFVTTALDPNTGAPTRSAPTLDLTSINASNLILLSLGAAGSGLVGYDPPKAADYVVNGDHGTLTIHKSADPNNGGSRRWPANTVMVVAVRGGANGVKVTNGAAGGLQPQPAMFLLLQDSDLTLPQNQALLPGATRADKATAGAQLEQIRKAYLTPFVAIDSVWGPLAHREIATMGTFKVADTSRRTHVETDPSAGRIPLPSDLLTDATGHLSADGQAAFNSQAAGLGTGLATLDGFGTTAMVLSQTSTAIQASTVAGGVFIYEVVAANPPFRRLLEATEALTASPAKKPEYAAEPSPITQAALSGGKCSDHPTEPCLSTAIGLQPGVPATASVVIPPLKEATIYVVLVSNKVKDLNGDPLTRSTLGKILFIDPALNIASNGKSTLAGVTDAQAVGLDKMRQAINGAAQVLAAEKGITRDQLVMGYTFKTQSIKAVAAQLAALPYADQTGNLTPPTGAATSFYCGGTALANTAVCAGTLATSVAAAFNDYGIDPAVAPNANIGYLVDTAMATFNKLLCNAGDTKCVDTGAFNPSIDPATAVKETVRVLIALPQPGTPSFAGGCIPGSSGNSPNGVCTLPLIVFRHGLNGGRAAILNVADRLTAAGYAVAAIDADKHGDRAFCDPTSTTPQCVGDTSTTSFCTPDPAAAGEGDTKGKGPGHCASGHDFQRRPPPTGCTTCTQAKAIPLASGNYLISPNLFRTRDTLRQDIIDQSALARVLSPNPLCDKAQPPTNLAATCANKIITPATGVQIDPARIFFVGSSLGAIQGTVDVAANPRFSAAALNVGGGTIVDVFTDSNSNLSAALGALLKALGITSTSSAAFLQFVNVAKWVLDPADPINFAKPGLTDPLLKSPLLGNAQVPSRPVIGQMALCDSTVANTWNTNLYLNLGLGPKSATTSTLTTFVAGGLPAPTCPANLVNHGFIGDWKTYGQGATSITQQAQDDITNFFNNPVTNLPPPARTTP